MGEKEVQAINDDLERKLDEIKNALRMKSETKSVIDDLEQKLNGIEKKIENGNTRAGLRMDAQIGLTGIIFSSTIGDLLVVTGIPKLIAFGIAGVFFLISFIYMVYSFRKLSRG